MSGLPTRVGQDGRVQNPTMIFRLGGVDVAKFLTTYGPDSIMGTEVSDLMHRLHNQQQYRLPRTKIFLFPTCRPGELLCNCTRVIGADGRELDPLLAADLSEAEVEGRRQVREYARFFADHLAGCEASFVNDTGVQVGVRQTRQITGARTLTNEDVVKGAKFATGIARSPWPIEVHSGSSIPSFSGGLSNKRIKRAENLSEKNRNPPIDGEDRHERPERVEYWLTV